MEYIDSGKKDGATLHLGGGRHSKDGYFVQPTIFTECTLDMKIMKEEIFGPVAAIIKFKTEEGRSPVEPLGNSFCLLVIFIFRGH
jgi:aldehyde dehydrogenase (NAD+)